VHPLRIERALALEIVVHGGAVLADELTEVFVRAHDHHARAFRAGALGQRRDHVVRLVALRLEHRQAEGTGGLLAQLELRLHSGGASSPREAL